MVTVDLDGDRRDDLAFAGPDANGQGLVVVLLSNGDGTFRGGGGQPRGRPDCLHGGGGFRRGDRRKPTWPSR